MPIQHSLEAAMTRYEVSPHKGVRISADDVLEAKQLLIYYALRFEYIKADFSRSFEAYVDDSTAHIP